MHSGGRYPSSRHRRSHPVSISLPFQVPAQGCRTRTSSCRTRTRHSALPASGSEPTASHHSRTRRHRTAGSASHPREKRGGEGRRKSVRPRSSKTPGTAAPWPRSRSAARPSRERRAEEARPPLAGRRGTYFFLRSIFASGLPKPCSARQHATAALPAARAPHMLPDGLGPPLSPAPPGGAAAPAGGASDGSSGKGGARRAEGGPQ